VFEEIADFISMHDFEVPEFLLRIASPKLSYVDTRSAITTIRYLPRSTGSSGACRRLRRDWCRPLQNLDDA